MRCVITGHTKGLGKAIFEYFNSLGYEVVGLSRSNGYDISTDVEKIVSICEGCDIFVNNAYRDDSQLILLNRLYNKVKKIIVCGSVSSYYGDIVKTEYVEDKKKLNDRCRFLSLSTDKNIANILYLDLSFIEQTTIDIDTDDFSSDYLLTFDEIISSIDFWLKNPKVRQIEFQWKFTDFVESELIRINQENIDALENVNLLSNQIKSI